MRIVRTTAAALISGVLISGAVVTAWSAPPASEGQTVTQATSPGSLLQAASGILAAPEFPRIRRDAHNNCKPGQMYSAHDIVGDPQSCILGNSGFSGIGGVPTIAAPGL